jgi:hypothetical protein
MKRVHEKMEYCGDRKRKRIRKYSNLRSSGDFLHDFFFSERKTRDMIRKVSIMITTNTADALAAELFMD